MPVWHARAQKLVDAGKLAIVGLVQEQHPDRARLYLQWQKIDWPVMWDPLNLTQQSAVPIFTAIDEYGIVRLNEPDPDTIERDFLDKRFSKPESTPSVSSAKLPGRTKLRLRAQTTDSPTDWATHGDAEVLWGGPAGLEEAIGAYDRAIHLVPEYAEAHFRLGVCYRMRYDSPRRKPGDFQRALDQWQAALDLNPNQYIWRRRIQQYGPRLDKPYPFYDWVARARRDIRARGETPVSLTAEPSGAEVAAPLREFERSDSPAEPDPGDRITRDDGHYIRIESAVAPPHVRPGDAVRVHLILRPDATHRAHWNNEAEPLRLWVRLPAGWLADRQLVELPNPRMPASAEVRELNFEIRVPETAPSGIVMLRAYALYNVCEDVAGRCLFRRQDISLPIVIAGK